jgi:hypothetical protein
MWPFRKPEQTPPSDLKDYICRYWRLSPDTYTDCNDLLKALRADGDDAFEFLEGLVRHFALDFSRYDWRKFQHSEGELLGITFEIEYLLRRLFGRARDWPDPSRTIHPISTAHLEEVVRRKAWFDPPDVSRQQGVA